MTEKEILQKMGYNLNGGRFLPTQGDEPKIAMDAALQTVANVQVPALFSTYYSPEIVTILQAPLASTEIFNEEKRGDWKDTVTMFPVAEYVGKTTAYSDFGRGTTAETNVEFIQRDTYKNQIFIQVGDLEQELTAAAKINLLSEKQAAAAQALALDANKFNLFGIDGMNIVGLLNDPALPAAIDPAAVSDGASGTVTGWANKTAIQIYNDVLSLFNQISKQANGYVRFDTPMILAIPPSINFELAKVTDLGIAPNLEALMKYFRNLKFVVLPQLEDEDGVASAMLIVPEIAGKKTGCYGFLDKLRTFRVVQEHSSMSQKWGSSTTGALIFYPFAIATMTGIQADSD